MIVAIKSDSLRNYLLGHLNRISFEGHSFKAQTGTEKHPEYDDHLLVCNGFETNYSNNRKWETINVYARETTLDEIKESMPDENEDDVFNLEYYTSAVEENQTLYDSVLIEARINCVREKQKNIPFNKKLEEIQNTYNSEEERETIIEESCRGGATTYILQGVFGQDVFDRQHGIKGAGLLGMCLDSILDPYLELKQILRRK